ncbi:MAG: hypothetical protein P8Z78_14645 [Gammaproteobacteria bacterium]
MAAASSDESDSDRTGKRLCGEPPAIAGEYQRDDDKDIRSARGGKRHPEGAAGKKQAAGMIERWFGCMERYSARQDGSE